jgi:hypothetical protein
VKKIVAACIDQVIQFDSRSEFESWKSQLHGIYRIEQVTDQEDGKVMVHVKKGYNNSPMDIEKG